MSCEYALKDYGLEKSLQENRLFSAVIFQHLQNCQERLFSRQSKTVVKLVSEKSGFFYDNYYTVLTVRKSDFFRHLLRQYCYCHKKFIYSNTSYDSMRSVAKEWTFNGTHYDNVRKCQEKKLFSTVFLAVVLPPV